MPTLTQFHAQQRSLIWLTLIFICVCVNERERKKKKKGGMRAEKVAFGTSNRWNAYTQQYVVLYYTQLGKY